MTETIAVFSDMHGNGVGFAAALEDIQRRSVDRMLCLGDTVQGGCEPARVIELLQGLDCETVLGNSDSFILTGATSEQVPQAAVEIGEWTRDQIGNEGMEFLRGFKPTIELEIPGDGTLLAFHGSPKSFDDVLLPDIDDDEMDAFFDGTEAAFLAGGHTHLQWVRHVGKRTFFNPGSAGAAYNAHLPIEIFYFYPYAEYALLHCTDASVSVEFCHVPFEVDEMERRIKASGRPYSEREADRYRPPARVQPPQDP